MSKILSDEDGDTIWNDPTPSITNIDDERNVSEILMWLKWVADRNEGLTHSSIEKAEDEIREIITNKIKEAELREAKKIFSMLWDEDGAPFQRDDPPAEILRYIEKLEGSQDER